MEASSSSRVEKNFSPYLMPRVEKNFSPGLMQIADCSSRVEKNFSPEMWPRVEKNFFAGLMQIADCSYKWKSTHKQQNKMVKIVNGNGRRSLNIVQWNMGAKLWQYKTDEARQLLSELNPDIFIVAEANFKMDTPLEKKSFEGYSIIITPIPMNQRVLSRMIVLVRDGIKVEVINYLMEDDTTSIWMEFTRSGKKKLMIGAIYREHTVTGIPTPNNTSDIPQQIIRWKKILKQWSKVGSTLSSIVRF